MGISATASLRHGKLTREYAWPGISRRPRVPGLRGLEVRVSEVDDLPIPYFEKPGKLWTTDEIDDFFEWPFHRPQQREVVLLISANVRRATAFQVDLDDVEVVMQETWLARADRIAGYDPALGRPMGWVLRGMCYRLRDRVKTRGRQAAIAGGLSAARSTPGVEDLSAAEWQLIRTMDDGRRSAVVRGCIERLKPAYREVLLCDLQEMDQNEAAALLGISTDLVRQRRRRARKALRKILPERLNTPLARRRRTTLPFERPRRDGERTSVHEKTAIRA